LLEAIIIAFLTAIMAFLFAYIGGKTAMRKEIEQQKTWFFGWIKSQEGIELVATVGKLFGAGAMSALGRAPRGKTMNIFGIKVPSEVVSALIQKYVNPEKLIPEQFG